MDPAFGGQAPWEQSGMPGLLAVMERLLAPDGCPWDREQTLDSLRPYLIEEAYEVLEAMDDPNEHRKELGDLLLQIVFQAALRQREGQFNFEDVANAIRDKMIHRHPHVFRRDPNAQELDAQGVATQWERIKAEEQKSRGEKLDPFAGVPRALPSLQRAWRIQDKAGALGFDWPDLEGPMAKLDEEWAELREAIQEGDAASIKAELGDVLFVLVRLAQKLGVEAEDALRGANRKFERRFGHVLARCAEAQQDPRDVGLAVLDEYWDHAKSLEAKNEL